MGDLVELSTKDTPIKQGPADKLKPRYVRPLEVLKMVSPVAYRTTLVATRTGAARVIWHWEALQLSRLA